MAHPAGTSPFVDRAPRADLPRGIYRWDTPCGDAVLFAIDSSGRLVDVAPESEETQLRGILNARDPLVSPAPAPPRHHAPALPRPPLTLVR